MRGVYLTPGEHKVEFRFQPPLKTLYLNILALVIGVAVAGFLVVTNRGPAKTDPAPSPNQPPSPVPSSPPSKAPAPSAEPASPAPAHAPTAPAPNSGASPRADRGKTTVKQKNRR
jgi:hypothetical protein